MQTERVVFPGAEGRSLAGRLDAPDTPPLAYALFARCFTCGKDILAASRIAAGLALRGIATMRFDFTGLGSSDGDFSNTDFSSNLADLLAAVAHLRSRGRAPALLTWVGRILPATPAVDAAEPPGTVVVEETRHGRLQESVRSGKHRLLADEPVEGGGNDTGPGPYDLLLAALGTCTAMTSRLHAERKDWPMGPVRVTLRHRKIHAEDCAECETRQGLLDEITREIALPGPLDAGQRAKLMEIADKCPVHRTLHSQIVIRTCEVGR
jgi:uncharacterized OsmC-like protein